jgi:adenylate cyclase
MMIAALLTALAAILGLVFSALVSAGVTRPVRQLLEGAKAVEAGHLDGTLVATSRDEIGHLTTAFNQMVEQLRLKERLRETFGKYVDPRVVEGLIEGPALAAEGQRRVMTVLFCDVKGFTSTSEGMTPQGLVKVMNRYFSTMSAPIRHHQGIIDKYIGDAIMAYWGPPFADDKEQARLASLAALDMLQLVPQLQAELPELLGFRTLPNAFDLRIGHRHRRGAGRQHRLRTDDELHRDGRHRESGFAARGRQQRIRGPHPGIRVNRGRCGRGHRGA